VDTSASGEFEPSTVRNSGSVPALRAKRVCTLRGVMVQPAPASWQLEQLRPLLPRLWKKGPVWSMTPARL